MTQIAPYCKAYPAKRFEEFRDWSPRDLPPPAAEADVSAAFADRGADAGGSDGNREAEDAAIEDYWFLQDSYIVTRGILPDEEIVFDQVTPEWIAFCQTTLEFAVPDDLVDESAAFDAETPAGPAAS